MKNKILLLMSGGLDSSTLLYYFIQGGANHVECMFFDYGQTHIKERLAARKICDDAGVTLHEARLPSVFVDSALVGSKPIPCGDSDANIVPNRNMNMISAATAYALQHDFNSVAIGCNADDAKHGFPDCSKHFLRAMRDAMRFCHTRPIALLAPFIHKDMSKADVFRWSQELEVPVDDTWSCYRGGAEPCGTCASCQLIEQAVLDCYEI